jgi:hypothetical protein
VGGCEEGFRALRDWELHGWGFGLGFSTSHTYGICICIFGGGVLTVGKVIKKISSSRSDLFLQKEGYCLIPFIPRSTFLLPARNPENDSAHLFLCRALLYIEEKALHQEPIYLVKDDRE